MNKAEFSTYVNHAADWDLYVNNDPECPEHLVLSQQLASTPRTLMLGCCVSMVTAMWTACYHPCTDPFLNLLPSHFPCCLLHLSTGQQGVTCCAAAVSSETLRESIWRLVSLIARDSSRACCFACRSLTLLSASSPALSAPGPCRASSFLLLIKL